MGTTNHKGIPVTSSVYPENWNPNSVDSYNDFISNVIKQNMANEGLIDDPSILFFKIRISQPLLIKELIRFTLSDQELQMSQLLYSAKLLLKGGTNGSV
ncbi:hypothetical protein [Sphingobacterium paramultivorum]|uniref:hypothetical protein n=1 Tax=Sphingobacterium paramultivorum TaxID=2886510 RepID=UPI00129C992C|nr:hypothetical protein [Sphingobacterium paramultivorum]